MIDYLIKFALYKNKWQINFYMKLLIPSNIQNKIKIFFIKMNEFHKYWYQYFWKIIIDNNFKKKEIANTLEFGSIN